MPPARPRSPENDSPALFAFENLYRHYRGCRRNKLEQYWERVSICDSYACRKDKGVHAAVDRLQRFIRQVTTNGQRRGWYLQLDIRNYFPRSMSTTIPSYLDIGHGYATLASPDFRPRC
jgi:hypothetical protein